MSLLKKSHLGKIYLPKCYDQLDQRIAKTRAEKAFLLLVLQYGQYPEIPLDNNAAELGLRQRVRKRDVSFGPHHWHLRHSPFGRTRHKNGP